MSNTTELRITFDPKHIPRLMPFKAVHDIRYYLAGICVQRAPTELGGVYLLACDGHTIAVIHDITGTIEGRDEAIVLIDASCTAAAKRASSEKRRAQHQRLLVKGHRVSIAPSFDHECTDAEIYIQPGRAVIEGKFPDWRKVMPDFTKLRRGALSGSTAVNAKYLARLAQLGTDKKFGGGVTLWQEGADKALICQIGGIPELVVAIMPMRGEDDEIQRALFKQFVLPGLPPVSEPATSSERVNADAETAAA